jgi:hypothetical protein
MKNVQVIDGADNATYSIFRATDEEFQYLFPGEDQDIELVEDFYARFAEKAATEILNNLWLRPVPKGKAVGVDGTLYYGYTAKRAHLPASKREIDRDPSQLNEAQRDLYERLREESKEPEDRPLPATKQELLVETPGGADLLNWFGGRVPSFHDAEVLEVSLTSNGANCAIIIHAFEMTSEVDPKGFFVLKNHVAVRFRFSGVTALELEGFNHQNVIYGLSLSRTAQSGFRLELEPCYGMSGFVEARAVAIELEPMEAGNAHPGAGN